MNYFEPFDASHKNVLIFMIAGAGALLAGAPRIRRLPDDRALRYSFAALLTLIGAIKWFEILLNYGWYLPLQVCDIALILTVFSFLGGNRYAGELAFFWGVAGSTQAVLTPDLHQGFPAADWWFFFATHCGVILGVLYLAVRGRFVLSKTSVWRVWAWSNLYAFIAGILNFILGANFGYLAAKPERSSLLDYMGPWPYYLLTLEVVALALFFLTYGLSVLIEKRAGGVGGEGA